MAFVVENVPYTPMPANLVLCGESFGLEVIRHRWFLTEPFIMGPQCIHERGGTTTGRYVAFRHSGSVPPGRTIPPRRQEREFREAMGTTWMPLSKSRQAIPPAYTEFIGRQLLALL